MSFYWMSLCWVSSFIYWCAECRYSECRYAECRGARKSGLKKLSETSSSKFVGKLFFFGIEKLWLHKNNDYIKLKGNVEYIVKRTGKEKFGKMWTNA